MDLAVLMAPVATAASGAITSVLPLAIPVLVALASVTIALGVFRKFGVKR